ncbi:MAG: flagellar hook-associated 2 domain protein [Actinomycetia bacterium]|nr:flagellar hook-associated 2 domain protein [Actinomycetes bacterium]
MATSLSSVDGLISGMSTSTIIQQLLTIDKVPQQRLVAKQNTLADKITSYQSINTKFLTLQAAADKLTLPETWTARSAVSSSSSVSATAGSGALTGSITFDVQQIAKAQAYVSHGAFSSTSAIVTTSPSVTITKGDAAPVTVNTGDGSLAAVVSGINAANAGVRAAAVQVAPGSFKLQLTSTTTGADSDFTIADGGNATPFGTLDESVGGQDAKLLVGDALSVGKYEVASHSNTFTDVLPGVTLTVKAPATAVTVDVSPAGGDLAGSVQAMVVAANSLLTEIKKQTAYDPATKSGAPLVGDNLVRSLQSQVLSLVTSSGKSTASAGVQLAKDGTITFDSAKFQAAFTADPTGTATLFTPGGSSAHPDPPQSALASKVTLLKASDQTQPGTYDVKITAAGRQARAEVTGTIADGEKLTINVPGKTALVLTAGPTDDLTTMASRINEASATGSLGIVARVESGALEIRTQSYGAAPTLTVTTDAVAATAAATVAGADVAGTINGVVAKGSGQTLIAPPADNTLHGVALKVTATDADVATAAGLAGANTNLMARWTYSPGLAARMDSLAGDAVRTGTGRLSLIIAGNQSEIDDLGLKITDWDTKLAAKEAGYRTQYANLETALGKLKSQGTWLSGQLSSLPTSSG